MNAIAAAIVLGTALLVAILIIAYPYLRQRLRPPPALTATEHRLLARYLPWHGLLNARQHTRLATLCAQLLAEVRFVGCGGLVLDRSMQLLIAAQASLLHLGTQPADFALPREVLVYPDAFYIPNTMPDEHGLIEDLPTLASGEAWPTGRVILSWRDVEAALAGADANVVLHEFAHMLDFAAPGAAGAPPLADYDSWSTAFGRVFEQLRHEGSPVIDVYGATNPAEFFAVAVEAFFQRGADLASAHADLYQVMAAYFDLETAHRRPRFRRPPIRPAN